MNTVAVDMVHTWGQQAQEAMIQSYKRKLPRLVSKYVVEKIHLSRMMLPQYFINERNDQLNAL